MFNTATSTIFKILHNITAVNFTNFLTLGIVTNTG